MNDIGGEKRDIILVDKPKGITSFDVIRELRKKIGIQKMGHAGTLDPMATGLMIIGVNEGTKKLTEFIKLPKTYEAEILFGTKTDSGDMDGKVLEKVSLPADASCFNEAKLNETLVGMVGTLELVVPAYSAIKVGGEKLYEKARSGEVFTPPTRQMQIREARLISVSSTSTQTNIPVVKVFFSVSSGTYIRSLAEELGRRLGVPATLCGLRRTSIADFRVEDAMKL